MKLVKNEPPRKFQVGLQRQLEISDCGNIFLEADEQVTFVSPTSKRYDVAAKSWGFYATPSINSRLKQEGFKTALVQNSQGRIYIMLVDVSHLEDFQDYIRTEKNVVLEWLDERIEKKS